MSILKNFFISIGLKTQIKWIRDFFILISNYMQDAFNYFKYSNVFSAKKFEKIESNIIMSYHSIEKGFLYENKKYRFSKIKVETLISQLKKIYHLDLLIINSQISAAINILFNYYDYHDKKGVDISDFFSINDYKWLISLVEKTQFDAVYCISKDDFYKKSSKKFDDFSFSRKSIRDFSEEDISNDLIVKAIEISNNAPSVCNRQSCKNYIVQDKNIINNILALQGGFSGYEKNVKKIIILVSNKNYFFSIGERNQLYIDGGIYLMNLLYSLHFFNIAACPANWGKCVKDDKALRKFVDIPLNEQVICIIPIGIANNKIIYTHSKRREVKENTVFL